MLDSGIRIPLHGAIIMHIHVMAVQQESVTIVKIISLAVSFISLALASIVADEVFHYDGRRNNELNMKNKLKQFATHLLLLSSRLFAAALVTASCNTGLWVVFIFAFHYIPILKCDLVSLHVLVSLYAKIVRANKDTTDRVQLDSYSNPVEIAAFLGGTMRLTHFFLI